LPLTENKKELWGDNIWEDADGMVNGDLVNINDTLYKIQLAQQQAFKTINVDKMELYNCDRILKEDAVPMIADFKLEGYSQKLNSMIYVVYKKRNAVLTYYPEQFASGFKLLPDEDFTIFTYSKDGKIAILDRAFTSTFEARLNANKKVTFPMKVFAKLPSTKKELAALTGL
ncbi:MAG: hypothetical protein JWN78_2204, partial [Bacteroidota bacterium]|nr:hypothetical protein [Bacteroidota bacterium]